MKAKQTSEMKKRCKEMAVEVSWRAVKFERPIHSGHHMHTHTHTQHITTLTAAHLR